MKYYIHRRYPLLLLLLLSIVFGTFSSSASGIIGESEHREHVKKYVNEIRRIQNHIFALSQTIVCSLPQKQSDLTKEINYINTEIDKLSNTIAKYLEMTPQLSSQKRDATLARVALDLARNALYQLNRLVTVNNNVDRSLLLEDFYLFKKVSNETLITLERNLQLSF